MSHDFEKLDNILKSRYHGAISLSGFRFQILYSLYRMFDLFSNGDIQQIGFEGIEDVDLKGLYVGNQYIQVKTSGEEQGWNWINRYEILDKFIEVFKVNPEAKFITVINFQPTGALANLVEITKNETIEKLPKNLSNHLQKIATRCDLPLHQLIDFVKSLKFEQISETEIITRIEQFLIQYFDVTSGNVELYISVLFSNILTFATLRASLNKNDIIKLQLQISDWISMGVINPVVQEGWLQPLQFNLEENVIDYYEGKSARPAHILANLDVQRSQWLSQISTSFGKTKICVIRASSGQGKSTLIYRYAHNNFDKHAVFVLKKLDEASMVTPLKIYIEARAKLGLPLLILIDDLNHRVKEWYQLIKEMTRENVYFLIATREENWFRYASDLHSFSYTTIFLTMSFNEAKLIYLEFEKQGKIANNVESVAWAYDKVSAQKLLIEFVFLITHGEMLAERLEQQIKNIQSLQEDPVKFEILRIVSLAQIYGVRVAVTNLVHYLSFRDDPDMILQSLKAEYLLLEQGFVEGLHFVRSEHLIHILHQNLPVLDSLKKLITIVSDNDIYPIVRLAFSENTFAMDKELLLEKILEETNNKPLAILSAINGFFESDERNYFFSNKHIFDEIFERSGTAGLTIFTSDTLPATTLNTTKNLLKIVHGKNENLNKSLELLDKISKRGVKETQLTPIYLRKVVPTIKSLNYKTLEASIQIKIWCSFYAIAFKEFDRFIENEEWRDSSFLDELPIKTWFLRVLWDKYPKKYRDILKRNKKPLIQRFLRETFTLNLVDNNKNCFIEFIVDEEKPIHEQALERLEILGNWMPHYEIYHSQGLYPLTAIERLGIDETKKNLSRELLHNDFYVTLNAAYIKVVNENYASKSIYEWVNYIYELRKSLLILIQGLVNRFECNLSGKLPANLQSELDKAYTGIKEIPDAPEQIDYIFKQEKQAIISWIGGIENFIRGYFTSPVVRKDQNQTRLYYLNLRDALSSLPDMQIAFETIVERELSYLETENIKEVELAQYKYLYSLLEYQYDVSSNPIAQLVDAKTFIQNWEVQKQQDIKQLFTNHFSSLAAEGLTLYFPNTYLTEAVLQNICIGFELIDATNPFGHIEYLLRSLATLDLDYSYVYVMPFIHETPFQEYVYKVPREFILALLSGKFTNKISIFPVSVPSDFFNILGIEKKDVIPSSLFVRDAHSTILKLISLKNEIFYLHSYLKFKDIFEVFEEPILSRHKHLVDTLNTVLIQANHFGTSSRAKNNWSILWEYIEKQANNLLDWEALSSEILSSPVVIQDDHQINKLYGDYINSEYLSNYFE